MKKGNIILVLTLALVWIILVESITMFTVISGIAIGAACIFFAKKYLPLPKIIGVDFNRLATYPLFLLGQIFSSSIYVSKIIIFGARTDIVKVETNLTNDSLRVMLADSVTLTPGSMLLELDEGKMVVLWLRQRTAEDPKDSNETARQIMGKLEDKLQAAEK